MANELLDFVMSLVRDPDAAARYAENPDQAILDANLTNVTSADVSNLIPVVSESLSSAVPTVGQEALVGDMGGNVWASGAATAAFDAFDDHVPVQVADDATGVITEHSDVADVAEPDQVLDEGLDVFADAGVPGVIGADDASLQVDEPVIDDVHVVNVGDIADHVDSAGGSDPSDPQGFDIF